VGGLPFALCLLRRVGSSSLFMPHKLKRITGRQDLHFITFTCYQRRKFLASVRSKNIAVRILGEVRARFKFQLLGYVLMPDHVHLLISEPTGSTPAKAMQVFKQRVSRKLRGLGHKASSQMSFAFPDDEELPLRFWQRRYFDLNVYSSYKIREKLDYMHANPVKEKLVRHPKDWPWSSWAAYVGREALLAIDFVG
jgi:putative transposase